MKNAERGNKGLNQAREVWRKSMAMGILSKTADAKEANFVNV